MSDTLTNSLKTYLKSLPAEISQVSELEFRFNTKVPQRQKVEIFTAMADHFKTVDPEYKQQNILSIKLDSDERVRLYESSLGTGILMRTFCISENLKLDESGVEILLKQRTAAPLDNDQYHYRIGACSENEVSQARKVEIREIMVKDHRKPSEANSKNYRFMRRNTYQLATFDQGDEYGNANLQLDLSVVKMANGNNFRNSDVLNKRETYEMELEITNLWIGNLADRERVAEQVTEILTPFFSKVLTITQGGVATVPLETISAAKLKYQQITKHDRFVGANIVSLEHKDLLVNGDLKQNKDKYLVVDKADGERHMLFTNDDGDAFLINKSMFIKPTNLQLSVANTLVDGELIKLANGNYLFMGFDLLYLNGESQRELDFYVETEFDSLIKNKKGKITDVKSIKLLTSTPTCRYGKLLTVLNNVSNDMLTITVKNFYPYTALNYLVKQATSAKFIAYELDVDGNVVNMKNTVTIGDKTFNYPLDGLIFQPMTGVESHYPEKPGTMWKPVKKWKPVALVTNDFKMVWNLPIRRIKGTDTPFAESLSSEEKDKLYMNVQLFFTNGRNQTTPFTMIHERWCMQINEHGHVLLPNGQLVRKSGSIVEMAWDRHLNHWKPLRVRNDKQYPNIAATVYSNWSLVQLPVLYSHLTHMSTFIDYWRQSPFGMMDGLRESHREIKHLFLKRTLGEVRSRKPAGEIRLLDLGAGHANDVHRWHSLARDNLLTEVVGIDRDNQAVIDGNSRIKSTRRKSNATIKLITADMTRPIDAKEVIKKFDVVSSFFSIHYAMISESAFRNLCYNVSRNLVKDGWFIGTSFDREALLEFFKTKPPTSEIASVIKKDNTMTGNILLGKKEPKKEVEIWRIENLNKDDGEAQKVDKEFGYGIDVTVQSIGNTHREYVACWTEKTETHDKSRRFHKIAEEYGLNLIYDQVQSFSKERLRDEYIALELGLLNTSEKAFSDLNYVFVFKKTNEPNLVKLREDWGNKVGEIPKLGKSSGTTRATGKAKTRGKVAGRVVGRVAPKPDAAKRQVSRPKPDASKRPTFKLKLKT